MREKFLRTVFLFIIFQFLFVFSSNATDEKYKTSHISGIIDSCTSENILLAFKTDLITEEYTTHSIPINVNNSFSFKFDLIIPLEGKVIFNKDTVPFIIQPGQHMIIRFSENDMPGTFKWIGDTRDNNLVFKVKEKILRPLRNIDRSIVSNYTEFLQKVNDAKSISKLLLTQEEKTRYHFSGFLDSLMNYSIEYLSYNILLKAGDDFQKFHPQKTLYNNYYNVLKSAHLDLDKSFMSCTEYTDFIIRYVHFRENNPEFEVIEFEGDIRYVVKSSDKILYSNIGRDTIQSISYNDTIIYSGIEFLKESNSNYVTSVNDYKWLKVFSPQGNIGWVSAVDLFELNSNLKVESKDVPLKLQVVEYARIVMSGTKLLKDPEDKIIIRELEQNEELEYLGIQTEEKYEQGFGAPKDYLYRVRDAKGNIGWIPRVSFKRYNKEVLINSKYVALIPIEKAKKYLEGIPLFFFVASEIIANYSIESEEVIFNEVVKFDAKNIYPIYKNWLFKDLPVNFINKYNKNKVKLLDANMALLMHEKIESSFISLSSRTIDEIEKRAISIDYTTQLFGGFIPEYQKYQTKNTLLQLYLNNTINENIRLKSSKVDDPSENLYSENIENSNYILEGEMSSLNILNVKELDNILYYLDSYNFSERFYSFSNLKSKNYKIRLKDVHPIIIVLSKGELKKHIFIEQGDIIEIDGKSLNYNSLSNDNNIVFGLVDGLYDYSVINSLETISDIELYYSNLEEEYLAILKNYHVTNEFHNFILNTIAYSKGYLLLSLFDEVSNIEKEKILSTISKIEVNNYSAVNLNCYFQYLYLYFDIISKEIQGISKEEYIRTKLFEEVYFAYVGYSFYQDIIQEKIVVIDDVLRGYFESNPYSKYNMIVKESLESNPGLLLNEPAPYFEYEDLTGNKVNNESFKDKYILLEFWATWCIPCIDYMNSTQIIYKSLPKDRIEFVYINVDKSKNVWENFMINKSLEGVQVHSEIDVTSLYHNQGLPHTYMIDPNGNIVYNSALSQLGFIPIEDFINKILN